METEGQVSPPFCPLKTAIFTDIMRWDILKRGGLCTDTRELQTFLTVSETLNYQKAADQLQYAPSTLFKHIQQLEAELKAPLLAREGRALRLTAEGERFLPHAQRMLSEYRAALGVHREESSVLTIGGCEMNIGNSLIDLLTRFAAVHPDIHLNMRTAPNASVPEMVRRGEVDLGFFYSTGRKHRELQSVRLYREPAFLVASRQSALAGAQALRYEDLDGLEFVYPHDSCCFVTMLMPELARRGVSLKRVTYLGGMQLVVDQARRDGAVTLAPQCALARFEETYGLVRLNMEEAPFSAWETILLGGRAKLPAVQALVRFSMREARRIVRKHALEAGAAPDRTEESIL